MGLILRNVIFTVLLAVAALGSAAAQSAPDNKAIRREIGDSTSQFFYPKLLNRYLMCDTTLNIDDYRHLYYGYIYQPEYNPFETSPEADSVYARFNSKEVPDANDLRIMINQINHLLVREPFSPRHLNMLVYAYGQIGDHARERSNYMRLEGIVEAIISSGTGLSEERPWHIISFSHTEDIMGYLDLRYSKRIVISRSCEFVPLLVKTNGVKGYYFDYSRIYTKRPVKCEDSGKRGLMFNNIRIR